MSVFVKKCNNLLFAPKVFTKTAVIYNTYQESGVYLMNVSHKCHCYGLINPACTNTAVKQTERTSPTEQERENEQQRITLLRGDLVAGIYKLQIMKDGAALCYVGELGEIKDEITELNSNCEDIKSLVVIYKEENIEQ